MPVSLTFPEGMLRDRKVEAEWWVAGPPAGIHGWAPVPLHPPYELSGSWTMRMPLSIVKFSV